MTDFEKILEELIKYNNIKLVNSRAFESKISSINKLREKLKNKLEIIAEKNNTLKNEIDEVKNEIADIDLEAENMETYSSMIDDIKKVERQLAWKEFGFNLIKIPQKAVAKLKKDKESNEKIVSVTKNDSFENKHKEKMANNQKKLIDKKESFDIESKPIRSLFSYEATKIRGAVLTKTIPFASGLDKVILKTNDIAKKVANFIKKPFQKIKPKYNQYLARKEQEINSKIAEIETGKELLSAEGIDESQYEDIQNLNYNLNYYNQQLLDDAKEEQLKEKLDNLNDKEGKLIRDTKEMATTISKKQLDENGTDFMSNVLGIDGAKNQQQSKTESSALAELEKINSSDDEVKLSVFDQLGLIDDSESKIEPSALAELEKISDSEDTLEPSVLTGLEQVDEQEKETSALTELEQVDEQKISDGQELKTDSANDSIDISSAMEKLFYLFDEKKLSTDDFKEMFKELITHKENIMPIEEPSKSRMM